MPHRCTLPADDGSPSRGPAGSLWRCPCGLTWEARATRGGETRWAPQSTLRYWAKRVAGRPGPGRAIT